MVSTLFYTVHNFSNTKYNMIKNKHTLSNKPESCSIFSDLRRKQYKRKLLQLGNFAYYQDDLFLAKYGWTILQYIILLWPQ